jgi:uncharacterized protein (DUF885 family)
MNRLLRWTLASAALGAAAPALPAQIPFPMPPRPTPVTHADSVGLQVNLLADEFMMDGLKRFPEIGTQLGLPGMPHDGLSDNSLAASAEAEREADAFLAKLRQVDGAALEGRPEGVLLAILREQAEGGVQSRVCRSELWGVNQMSGWQVQLPYLAKIQPTGTDALRAQAVSRWKKLPRYIDTETANLREGLRQGYAAPRIAVTRVLETLDNILSMSPAESPFALPAQADSTPAFRAEIRRIVADEIHPAIARHRDFLRDEYLAKSRENPAVGGIPNGAECYRSMVRGYTTLDVPAADIHRIGQEQMARIDAEMLQIARRSFNTDDVRGLLQRFRTDTAFTFRTRADIVAYAQSAVDRGKAAMPRWFGRLPKADVVIEPYKEFEEASAPGGSYNPPAADGSRPGVYNINTYKPQESSKVGLESTAFHETIPGHHLQLALAQERGDVHPIARFLGNSGFSEGWGLYSERLADEMGLFTSDLDRMGLLSNEALRAARMVVDPGIHVLGWSRQQAIDYMLAHTAEAPDMVATEVDRYIVWPGQATAYMLGNLEIRRLREYAERELGPRFDIREFHDRVLEDGTVPLGLLRAKIERWVAARKAAE